METDREIATEPTSSRWQAVLASVAAEYAGWPVVSLIRDALHERCRQHHLRVDEDTLTRAAIALSQQG